MSPELQREPLRDQIYSYLRDQIVSGELEPGTVIKESRLADTFDVSRTPVREALLTLRARDFLSAPNGKGFVVPELEPSEGNRLYRTVGLIESAILREEIEVADVDIDQLRSITDERESNRSDSRENLRLDRLWHRTLISAASDSLDVDFLTSLRDRLLRYDLIYIYSQERVDIAVTGHREIEAALEKGRRDEAARLLNEHWREGVRLIQELNLS